MSGPEKPRCRGTTAEGNPCRSPVVDPETGFCPAHDPEKPEEMRRRGALGAEATARRFHGKGLDVDDLPALRTPKDAERWAEEVARATAEGRLSSSAGNTVLRALKAWREAREAGQVSEQLEALHEAIKQWRDTGSPQPLLELVR